LLFIKSLGNKHWKEREKVSQIEISGSRWSLWWKTFIGVNNCERKGEKTRLSKGSRLTVNQGQKKASASQPARVSVRVPMLI
jgi:hypothetical protein